MPINITDGGVFTPFPALFNFINGTSQDTDANFLSHPPVNQRFENEMGIEGMRVTDVGDSLQGPVSYIGHEYSRVSVFSAADVNGNSARFLAWATNGFWYAYDVNIVAGEVTTVTFSHQVNPLFAIEEPHWHPTDPDRFYFQPKFGYLSFNQYEWDCVNEVATLYNDWTAVVQAADPAFAAATGMWMDAEGTLSDNGKYGCYMIHNGLTYLGLACLDIELKTVVGVYIGGGTPNHSSMSKDGTYCVPSWYQTGGPDSNGGAYAMSRDFSTWLRLSVLDGEHACNCTGADGVQYHVSIEFWSGSNIPAYADRGSVYVTNMDTQEVTFLYSTTNLDVSDGGGGMGVHFCGEASDIPGWILVSHYAIDNKDGMYLVNIHNPNPAGQQTTMYKVGSAHTIGPITDLIQPHGVLNPGGNQLLVTSNADNTDGGGTSGAVDYMYHLPIDSLPAAQ